MIDSCLKPDRRVMSYSLWGLGAAELLVCVCMHHTVGHRHLGAAVLTHLFKHR